MRLNDLKVNGVAASCYYFGSTYDYDEPIIECNGLKFEYEDDFRQWLEENQVWGFVGDYVICLSNIGYRLYNLLDCITPNDVFEYGITYDFRVTKKGLDFWDSRLAFETIDQVMNDRTRVKLSGNILKVLSWETGWKTAEYKITDMDKFNRLIAKARAIGKGWLQ